ncbi:MAG: pilus assembly PilX N-terminal domain-containing protein [Desulfuromonadaceae bacterium]|nr:pilus assembly PilX N-terminal domain-containing protein [Desulfuromonadaceae bacterium]
MAELKRLQSVRNESGVILITVLLLMLIMTFLGIMVIDTSTIDMQIAGNFKRTTTAFEGAEAGVEMAIPIIERTMSTGSMLSYNALTTAPNSIASDLVTEITGGANNSSDGLCGGSAAPDIVIADLNGVKIEVDIDRLVSDAIAGSSLEFASGYEGIGAGAAGGGTSVLFRIVSQGTR